MNHKQVKLKCPEYGNLEEVDSEIADLLKVLWENKIYTYMSCQDSDGYVWLQFSTKKDFLRFLDMVEFYSIKIDNVEFRKRLKHSTNSEVGFFFPKNAKNRVKNRLKKGLNGR